MPAPSVTSAVLPALPATPAIINTAPSASSTAPAPPPLLMPLALVAGPLHAPPAASALGADEADGGSTQIASGDHDDSTQGGSDDALSLQRFSTPPPLPTCSRCGLGRDTPGPVYPWRELSCGKGLGSPHPYSAGSTHSGNVQCIFRTTPWPARLPTRLACPQPLPTAASQPPAARLPPV